MRYLLQFMLVLSLAACQNPRMETLEAEKAGLIFLYEKEAEMTQALEERALQEAERAMEMAISAQTEAEIQKAAYEKCKSGK